ncbi:hypothetical protein ACJX0J_013400, partial [Zea mays]
KKIIEMIQDSWNYWILFSAILMLWLAIFFAMEYNEEKEDDENILRHVIGSEEIVILKLQRSEKNGIYIQIKDLGFKEGAKDTCMHASGEKSIEYSWSLQRVQGTQGLFSLQ